MIVISVCEDEQNIKDLIEKYINIIMSEQNIEYRVLKYSSGEALLEGSLEEIDVLILDIKMKKLTGIDVASKIREIGNNMEIVFITSSIEYVQDGYEVELYRYLLKPVEIEKLKINLMSCIKKIENKVCKYVIIKKREKTVKILIVEIKYIKTRNRHITISSLHEDIDLVCTLNKVEKDINSNNFIKCHNSFILNLYFVESIKK